MPPDAKDVPQPPERPDPMSCCGRGCSPCIFDYYDDAMDRWRGRIVRLGLDPGEVLESLGRPPND